MEYYVLEYYELDEEGGKYLVSETFNDEGQAQVAYEVVRNHDRCWQTQLHCISL